MTTQLPPEWDGDIRDPAVGCWHETNSNINSSVFGPDHCRRPCVTGTRCCEFHQRGPDNNRPRFQDLIGLYKDCPIDLNRCDDCEELKKRVAQLESVISETMKDLVWVSGQSVNCRALVRTAIDRCVASSPGAAEIVNENGARNAEHMVKQIAEFKQNVEQLRKMIADEFAIWDSRRAAHQYNDGVADGLDVADVFLNRVFPQEPSKEVDGCTS